MIKPAIEVKNLGKVYKINHQQNAGVGNNTFRDALVNAVTKPLSVLRGKKTEAEQFWALKDISFNVMPGEVIGIIGSNGSGKSTLLKVLSRIVDPATGEVIMRGKVASLLEVGTGFHPELTGRENIFFNGAILGMSQREIKEKFNEIVAFSEVEQFLDTPVKFYSSGMYVRLAFAVAAHLEPDILIVDEVLAVGDAAFQKKCLGKMQDVANQGRTVLFVSHSMPSVKALCKKAIWLNKGKIAAQGDIDEVAEKYQKSYEALLVSDLRKRERPKTATLEAQIVNVEVEEEGNPKASLIDSTKPMKIKFEIEAKKDLDNVYLHAGINNGGQMVLRFMSEHTSTHFSLSKGQNFVTCLIDPTKLTGGTYTLDCSILFPGREKVGHIDEVPEATLFTIKEFLIPAGDAYLTDHEAAYFVEHSWQHLAKD